MLTLADAIEAAFEAFRQGDWDRAEWMAHQVMQVEPDHPILLNLLGSVYYQRGNLPEAIVHYMAATDVKPNYAEAYSNLGAAFQAIGHYESALEALRRAIDLEPKDAYAHFNYGNVLAVVGQAEEALAAYHTALDLNPDFPQALTNLGNLQQTLGDLEAATATFRKVVALTPDDASAQINLANVLQEKGNYELAIGHYQRAAELRPYDPKLHFNLGTLHHGMGKLDSAKLYYLLALQLDSHHAESHHNLALILETEGQTDLAIAHLQQAISYKPDYAAAYNQLGLLWQARGELTAAIGCFREAVDFKPELAEAHLNLSRALLRAGQWQTGFAEYEWRWKAGSVLQTQIPRHRKLTRWDGQPLADRKLVVWAEADLGETLQLVRFLPMVAQRGAQVILECDRSLVPILQTVAGVSQVIARGTPLPSDCQVQIPLGSVPHLLEITAATLPTDPYLTSLVNPASRPPAKKSRKPRLGLVWRSQDTPEALQIPLDRLLAALEPISNDFSLHSLQPQLTPEEQTQLEQAGIPILPSNTPEETAIALADLDHVLSLESPIAQLTAALGKPVWILLPTLPHWVWMHDRETTPWYPSARLFRQKEATLEDALETLTDLIADLQTVVRPGENPPSVSGGS